MRSLEQEFLKWNDINFSYMLSTYQMISIFLTCYQHIKWYQFFLHAINISNDINFSYMLSTYQMISIFLTCYQHIKWYQFFNTLFIKLYVDCKLSNKKFSEKTCLYWFTHLFTKDNVQAWIEIDQRSIFNSQWSFKRDKVEMSLLWNWECVCVCVYIYIYIYTRFIQQIR